MARNSPHCRLRKDGSSTDNLEAAGSLVGDLCAVGGGRAEESEILHGLDHQPTMQIVDSPPFILTLQPS